MTMFVLLVFLIGAVLGMRFRVFVLIPAIGITLTAILAVCIVRGDSIAAFAFTAVLAASCLQVGYLGGVATHYGTALARIGRPRVDTPKTASDPSGLPSHSTGPAPSTAYRG